MNKKINESKKEDMKTENEKSVHTPVLLKEVIEKLDLKKGLIVFDGTLGGGGYSENILEKIENSGVLIATDLDSSAISVSKKKLEKFSGNKFFFQKNYSEIKDILKNLNIEKIDRAVLDLGFSSDQLKKSGRGISFLEKDAQLDMRLSDKNEENPLTARFILENYEEEELSEIFKKYGEEKHSNLVARKITEERKKETDIFENVFNFSSFLERVLGPFYKNKKINPATKIFQALRIEVNNELENLENSLENIFSALNSSGILAVVSFHSLEDKIIKKKFRSWEDESLGKRLNKKVIIPHFFEVKENKRARSAKLRLFLKN